MIARAKGAKGRADRLFSQLVRSRGACEACGEYRYDRLQTAHIISRRYSATRCDPRNAFCLCASCHRYYTDHPVAFAEFAKQIRGSSVLADLHHKARPGVKVDWGRVCVELKARLELEEDVA